MGKISTCDKITFKNQKKGENVEITDILHNAPSKRLFWNEFTTCSCQLADTPEEAR